MSRTRGPERFKADAAREALLDAGRDLLREHGIAPGLDRVRFEDAIERSGVPRTTAYRLFRGPGGPLARFRSSLLTTMGAVVAIEPTLAVVDKLLTDSGDVLERGDPHEMAELLYEVVRVAMNQRILDLSTDMSWRTYISTVAASLGIEGEQSIDIAPVAEQFAAVFERVGELFGIRPRAPLDWAGLLNVLVAATDGAALRMLEDASFRDIELPTYAGAPDGSWNGGSVIALSLFLVWCEPDPDASRSAAIGDWSTFTSGR